jgi:hypothetical protein
LIFDPKDYAHEPVKSSCRFARLKNPRWRAMLILRHVRRRLTEDEWRADPGPHVTDGVMVIDLCISRVNSDLKV